MRLFLNFAQIVGVIAFMMFAWDVCPGFAEPLPDDAGMLVERFEAQSAEIQKNANGKIDKLRRSLIAELKPMQDRYTQEAKLDEAVAIRDRIRLLRESGIGARPDPGTMASLNGRIGGVYYFRVTGRIDGPVWGTNVYTSDSLLAGAAVHAGVLRNQQTGVVKVTLLPGQASYQGTARNGVVSQSWQNFPMSYSVASASEEKPASPDEEGLATSGKKMPGNAHALSDLLNRNVVVYFASDRNVSGRVSEIGRDYLLVEGGASRTKFLINVSTFTYIVVLPKE